jgi:hypothetical protein
MAMSDDGSRPPIQERLDDMSEEFAGGTFGEEMMIMGQLGFHTFYDYEDDALTAGMMTVLHQAFESTCEELWLDEDIIRDNHGEVTPVTAAAEFEIQFDQLVGQRFADRMAEEIELALREREGSV